MLDILFQRPLLKKLAMLKKIMLSGIFAVVLSNIYAQKEYKIIAIGSYNCENFFDTVHDPNKKDQENTPTPKDYIQKQHNIATVIQQLGTDMTPDGAALLGLVEVENDNVLKDLIAQPELKTRHYKYEWFYTPDERGISTALIYNPKYFKVLASEPLHVATEKLPGKRTTRDILHVYGVLAGDTIHVFVNHWPSKMGGEAASAPGRRLAAGIAKHFIDSLVGLNPETKILLLGDLNDNPTSEVVMDIIDAKSKKENTALTDIYNPWIDMYKKGFGTENYMHEWQLIDQIMLSGAFLANDNGKWKYYDAAIYNKDFLVYHLGYNKGLPHRSYTASHVWDNGYSDHFPVLVYLVEKK